jgi:hypothetical protein
MHVLFVHSNFPARFRYLAPRLARDFGWRCTFATRNARRPACRASSGSSTAGVGALTGRTTSERGDFPPRTAGSHIVKIST